jgi:hypothetical protein
MDRDVGSAGGPISSANRTEDGGGGIITSAEGGDAALGMSTRPNSLGRPKRRIALALVRRLFVGGADGVGREEGAGYADGEMSIGWKGVGLPVGVPRASTSVMPCEADGSGGLSKTGLSMEGLPGAVLDPVRDL